MAQLMKKTRTQVDKLKFLFLEAHPGRCVGFGRYHSATTAENAPPPYATLRRSGNT